MGCLGGWSSRSWGREEAAVGPEAQPQGAASLPSVEAWPAGTAPSPTLLAPRLHGPAGRRSLTLGGHTALWGACDLPLAAFRCFLGADVLKCVCWILSVFAPSPPPSLPCCSGSFLTQHLCLQILSLGSFRAHPLCPSYLPLLQVPEPRPRHWAPVHSEVFRNHLCFPLPGPPALVTPLC